MSIQKSDMKLYVVTDRSWSGMVRFEDQVEAALASGATFLQLREKNLSHAGLVKEAFLIKELASHYKVPFVINDDIYAAKEVDADGVHIGQSDMEYVKARAILGPDKIIGMTANTPALALAAQQAGADYIGVGAVFHTSTKKDAKDMSRDTLLAITQAVNIPIVAIGGITEQNMDLLKGTGIDGIAVVSAIFSRPDIAAATAVLRQKADLLF